MESTPVSGDPHEVTSPCDPLAGFFVRAVRDPAAGSGRAMIPAGTPSRGAHPADTGEAREAAGPSAPGCTVHAPAADGMPSPQAPPVTSAASARAHVLALVRGCEDCTGAAPAEQAVTDLLLVTSELVANAFRHGGGLVSFRATVTPEGIRIGVHDRSADIPPVAFGSGALPDGHRGGGYGWPLIIKLARDISIERCAGGGKVVSVLVPLAP